MVPQGTLSTVSANVNIRIKRQHQNTTSANVAFTWNLNLIFVPLSNFHKRLSDRYLNGESTVVMPPRSDTSPTTATNSRDQRMVI